MVEDSSELIQRKSDHIRINLEQDVRSGITTGLECYRFTHQALPDLDLEDVSIEVTIFNKTLAAPILISSMTGGTREAWRINRILAEAAQAAHIAMGIGSQRAAIEFPDEEYSFRIRDYAPDTLIFANLGAVQLNYGYSLAQCKSAVEMAEADALVLHLNPLQEALQPNGNTRFSGLLEKIEIICRNLPVPVIVKEVGWGISGRCARQLANAGVAAIDVAGAGGTSWSEVEKHRISDPSKVRVAAQFKDWGISTADSIRQVRESAPDVSVIASGGLRNGIDLAKCIALGATLGGMAGPFLKAAAVSSEEIHQFIDEITQTLRIAMFVCGAGDLARLREIPLVYTPDKGTC